MGRSKKTYVLYMLVLVTLLSRNFEVTKYQPRTLKILLQKIFEANRTVIASRISANATSGTSEASIAVNLDNTGYVEDATILVTSSLIPSHPSIRIINETIRSCFEHIVGLSPTAPVLVAIDNPQPSYEKNTTHMHRFQGFIHNLMREFGPRIRVRISPTHQGATWGIFHSLDHIDTEFIYIIQHDLPFVNDIDHANMIKTMREYPNDLRIVRFNLYHNYNRRSDRGYCFGMETPVDSVNGLKFVKTRGWSDNNQLGSKRYYHELFDNLIDDVHKRIPMEYTMKNHASRNCSRWGPHLYGGYGDGPYIGHLDGRRSPA